MRADPLRHIRVAYPRTHRLISAFWERLARVYGPDEEDELQLLTQAYALGIAHGFLAATDPSELRDRMR